MVQVVLRELMERQVLAVLTELAVRQGLMVQVVLLEQVEFHLVEDQEIV